MFDYVGLKSNSTNLTFLFTVVGYWITLEVQSMKWDPAGMAISIKPGKMAPSLTKKGNETAKYIEKFVSKFKQCYTFENKNFQFDDMYIDQLNLVNERYIRTRFIQFTVGDTIINQEDIDLELTTDEERSTRIVMEVQFAKPEDKTVMTLKKFKETTMNLLSENETISVEPLKYFQAEGTEGIILQSNCSESKCPVHEAPTCVNEDFAGIPEHLIFKHKNNTKLDFPYNITVVEDGKQRIK